MGTKSGNFAQHSLVNYKSGYDGNPNSGETKEVYSKNINFGITYRLK